MTDLLWLVPGFVAGVLLTLGVLLALLAEFRNARSSHTGTLAEIIRTLTTENRRLNAMIVLLERQLKEGMKK